MTSVLIGRSQSENESSATPSKKPTTSSTRNGAKKDDSHRRSSFSSLLSEGENNDELLADEAVDELGAATPRSTISNPSPRFEAFVMTGEKMLRLNPKISPNYANAQKAHLRPDAVDCQQVATDLSPKRPFTDFTVEHKVMSKHTGRHQQRRNQARMSPPPPMASSHSENVLGEAVENNTTHFVAAINGETAEDGLQTANPQSHIDPTASAVTVNGLDHQHQPYGRQYSDTISTTYSSALPSPSPSSSSAVTASAAHHQHQHHVQPQPHALFTSNSVPSSPARGGYYHANDSNNKHGVLVSNSNNNDDSEECLVIPVDSQLLPQTPHLEQHQPQQSSSSTPSSAASTPLKERLNRLGNNEDGLSMMMMMTKRKGGGSSLEDNNGLSEEERKAAHRLAHRLYHLDGFKRSDVAVHLAKNNGFSREVGQEYCRLFRFGGLRLDAALRDFLGRFILNGESAERERILSYFSHQYDHTNPGLFSSQDKVHTLTCALLLLNSDLHGPNIGKRMTCRDFVDNLSQSTPDSSRPFPKDLLKSLYSAIKSQPFALARDDPTTDVHGNVLFRRNGTLPLPGGGHGQHRKQHHRGDSTSSSRTRTVDPTLPDPEEQIEYKKGWLMRKCVFDEDGKRTPFGRRGWKMMYGTVKGLVLYLHKDEKGFRRGLGTYAIFRNAVRLHHCYATKPTHYKKRQHVFRLRTATMGEYLFQTSDPTEVESWIEAINFVGASFSSPALPAPVCSNSSAFHRPLLPSTPSTQPLQVQAARHSERIQELTQRLTALKRDEAPPLTAKGPIVQQFFYKERYLEEELDRYSAYKSLLEIKLGAAVTTTATGGSGTVVVQPEIPAKPSSATTTNTTVTDGNSKSFSSTTTTIEAGRHYPKSSFLSDVEAAATASASANHHTSTSQIIHLQQQQQQRRQQSSSTIHDDEDDDEVGSEFCGGGKNSCNGQQLQQTSDRLSYKAAILSAGSSAGSSAESHDDGHSSNRSSTIHRN